MFITRWRVINLCKNALCESGKNIELVIKLETTHFDQNINGISNYHKIDTSELQKKESILL